MHPQIVKTIERFLNICEIAGLILVLFMAFAFQALLHELPCPLCLLQRVGFTAVAFGFLLNLRFGLRPSHYGLALLGAIFTAFVAVRQILLHIVPGTGAYGSAVFGLHFYTWSFIVAVLIILFTVIMLSFDRQYKPAHVTNGRWKKFTHVMFALVLLFALANAVSTYLECGFKQCPDNPTHYLR